MCHAALVLLITLAWLSEKPSWDGWRIIMLPFYEILMNLFAYFGLCDSARARTQHHFTLPGAYFVYVLTVAVTVYTRCLCSYLRRRRLWMSLQTKISTSVPRPFSIGLLTQTKSASLNRWKLCWIQAASHSNFRATPLWYFFLFNNDCSDTLRIVNASASNKTISQSVDQIRSSINDNDCFTISLAISKNIANLLCLLATVFILTMMWSLEILGLTKQYQPWMGTPCR